MKKIKKILIVLAVIIVIAVLAVSIVISTMLDKIAKTAIETVAPMITQTTVTVDSIKISLLTGSVGVNDFVIGNPAGYQTPFAVSVGKASVSVSPASLLLDKIVVHSISVNAPEITFEGNPFGANNLSQIQANVAGAPTTNTVSSTGSGKPAKKLEVDDFLISGAKVHASITGLNSLTGLTGATNGFTIVIPEIHLTGLGQGTDGITAAELTQKVLSQVSAAAIKGVVQYVKTNLNGAASGILNGVKSGASMDKIKSGLGGIFGK